MNFITFIYRGSVVPCREARYVYNVALHGRDRNIATIFGLDLPIHLATTRSLM